MEKIKAESGFSRFHYRRQKSIVQIQVALTNSNLRVCIRLNIKGFYKYILYSYSLTEDRHDHALRFRATN